MDPGPAIFFTVLAYNLIGEGACRRPPIPDCATEAAPEFPRGSDLRISDLPGFQYPSNGALPC